MHELLATHRRLAALSVPGGLPSALRHQLELMSSCSKAAILSIAAFQWAVVKQDHIQV